MEKDESFLVSIVIPVYNGGRYIGKCLSTIFRQEVDFPYEVICIDSDSADGSLDIIKSYPARILRINKNEFNHGLTRNLGISQANGKYVILMTQDAIPYHKTWLKTLVENIEKDEKVAGVYCRQIPQGDADILTKRNVNSYLTGRRERIVSFIQDRARYESMSPKERYIFCNFDNVCSCIRKTVWKKIHFRKTNFAEDLDWSKKVLEAGYKIIYEPEAIIIHSHRPSLLYEYKRHYINFKSLYKLFGFESVPNFIYALTLSFFSALSDMFYLLKRVSNFRDIYLFPKVPLLCLFRVMGQYQGTREGRKFSKRFK